VTLQTLSTVVALLVAVVALLWARHDAKRLERLTQSYWDLRYEQGQLRARMRRLEGEAEPEASDAAPQPGSTSFVPLSSLKR